MTNYAKIYQEAKKAKTMKSLGTKYVQWSDEGQQIVGAYLSHLQLPSRNGGVYNQYLFDTDDGLIKFALGAAVDSEAHEYFERGCVYAITYQGKERSVASGNEFKNFTIEEVGAVEELAANPDKAEGHGQANHEK